MSFSQHPLIKQMSQLTKNILILGDRILRNSHI